jgi:Dolichyl-phosphate-mannose-protein mannosyltransferase
MTAHLLGLAVANLCYLAAGAGMSRALGLWRAPRELLSVAAPAYLVGVAACGVAAEWALIAGLELARWQVLAGCALLAATGLRPRSGGPVLPRPPGRPAARTVIALQAAVGLMVVMYLADAAFRPLEEQDAWAMWTMKAKAIALLGGLDARVFAGLPYHGVHLDYPLLIPAIEAIGFRFIGAVDTQVIHVQGALLVAALLLAVPRLLADRVPAAVAWASALLIAVAPSLIYQAGAGLADVPLAVFFAMAAVCAWRWLSEGRRELLVLTVLFAAAVLATKREGGPFVAALFLVLLVGAGRGRRGQAVVAGAAAVATAIPWQLWLHANGVDTSNGEIPYAKAVDPSYLAGRLGRIPTGAASLVWHAVEPSAWLVIVPAAAVAVVLGVRGGDRRTPVFVAAVACLVVVSVVWAYWVGRPSLHYYLHHSARRVVTTPVVLLGAFLPVLCAAAARRRPERETLASGTGVSGRARR